MAKIKFPFTAKIGKKRKHKVKKNWRLIAIVVLLLGNFAWDAYNRVETVKTQTDIIIEKIIKE